MTRHAVADGRAVPARSALGAGRQPGRRRADPTGRVLDGAGEPVPDALVEICGTPARIVRVAGDTADGGFELSRSSRRRWTGRRRTSRSASSRAGCCKRVRDPAVLPGRGRGERGRPGARRGRRGTALDARRGSRARRRAPLRRPAAGPRRDGVLRAVTFDAIFVPEEIRAAVSDRAWVEAMLEAERALANAEALAGVVPAACSQARSRRPAASSGFDVDGDRRGGALRREPGRAARARAARARRRRGRRLRPLRRDEPGHRRHRGDARRAARARAGRRRARGRRRGLRGARRDASADADGRPARSSSRRCRRRSATRRPAGSCAVRRASARLRAPRSASGPARRRGGHAGGARSRRGRGAALLRRRARARASRWCRGTPTARASPSSARRSRSPPAPCAKIGLDVALLEQTEVGEVREPAGAGGSSTMPHKRNPSARRSRCARGASVEPPPASCRRPRAEHERALGAWQAEWGALSDALAYAGGAAAAVRGVRSSRSRSTRSGCSRTSRRGGA